MSAQPDKMPVTTPRPSPSALAAACCLALGVGLGLAGCDDNTTSPAQTPRDTGGPAVTVTEVVQPKLSTAPVVARFTHPTGLIIEDLKIGEGMPALPGAFVSFRHRGFVQATGECYEDSYRAETPIEMSLAKAPKRLQYGLVGMRAGGVRRLIIPPDLAFGDRGIPREEGEGFVVPPGATVIYEVELVNLRQFIAQPGENAPPAPASDAAPASDTK